MPSLDWRGVKFFAYPHEPRQVHGFVGGIGGPEVIVSLADDGAVGLADRDDALQGASRGEVRKVLSAAAQCYSDLLDLWEAMHLG